MAELTTGTYATLRDRLASADPAVKKAAADEIITRAYNRFVRIAAKVLNESFPLLGTRHSVESVVGNVYIKLDKTFRKVVPETPEDFFRLVAFKVRQTLLDMVDRDKRVVEDSLPDAGDASSPGYDPGTTTLDPAAIAKWSEFQKRVETLPEDEKAVFSMRYYLGMSNVQIAEALGIEEKPVSRRWLRAVSLLADYLPSKNID